MISDTQKAKNAIKWARTLIAGTYKPGKSRLGDAKTGYCCLGVGCLVTKTPFDPDYGDIPTDAKRKLGLKCNMGSFFYDEYEQEGSPEFYGVNSLHEINDFTKAGHKRIGKLLLSHPEWMFEPEVTTKIKTLLEQSE